MTTKGNTIKHFLKAILFIVCIGFVFSTKLTCEAGTTAAKEAFKAELRQMIFDVDISNHDISKYNLTITEFQEVYRSLKQDPETKWMIASYYSNFGVGYTYSGKVVRKVYLMNVDSDVMKRYKVLLSNVSRLKAGIEPTMTDIDKIIYLHDCLTELASYSFLGYQSYGACGILGEGLGVCAGYTKAMNLLLEDQGIQSIYISSPEMDHGWNGVALDGRWYHVDVTWDDPTSAKPGETRHTFLLMSDDAISTGARPHSGWEVSNADSNAKYDSTKYDNWYVHDIIGKMSFENGKWYYVDYATNCILENTVAGGSARVILNAKGETKLEMVDATAFGITYKQGGVVKQTGYEGVSGELSDVPVNVTLAEFYIMPEGSASYISVGNGYIENAKKSSDAEYVKKSIVTIPDVSECLDTNQEVVWNKITTSSSGKFFVKGYVQTVEPKEDDEPEADDEPEEIDEPEVVEETVSQLGLEAVFYLMLPNSDSYVSVGNGTVKEAKNSSNVEFVTNNIFSTPDLSKYVKTNQAVEWVKISISGSGKISVKGTVKTVEPETVDESEDLSGIEAVFSLMLPDSDSYISVGTGTVKEAKNSSNVDFVTSNIITIPDLSKYVKNNQVVNWTKISISGSGKISVKGNVQTVMP